jgi:hypothetical protein
MKLITALILSITAFTAQASDQNLAPKAPNGQIKILDSDTCWGVIKALGMPAAPNKRAFDDTWYPNSKGQYVRASCYKDGDKSSRRGYKSYVEVAPASSIDNEVARKDSDRKAYFKNQEEKAKATGVI